MSSILFRGCRRYLSHTQCTASNTTTEAKLLTTPFIYLWLRPSLRLQSPLPLSQLETSSPSSYHEITLPFSKSLPSSVTSNPQSTRTSHLLREKSYLPTHSPLCNLYLRSFDYKISSSSHYYRECPRQLRLLHSKRRLDSFVRSIRFLLPSKPSSHQSRQLVTLASAMERNGEIRTKRKQSPVPTSDRPAKHLKPETSLDPGDTTPANGTVYNVEGSIDENEPVVSVAPTQADSPEWQATIESVVKSVVSIHFCQTCSFDTELSMSSQATGFVVDAEKGYILTNRHVVCAGPFSGYCIFDNHEEVS
jgi:hypothetical protein